MLLSEGRNSIRGRGLPVAPAKPSFDGNVTNRATNGCEHRQYLLLPGRVSHVQCWAGSNRGTMSWVKVVECRRKSKVYEHHCMASV